MVDLVGEKCGFDLVIPPIDKRLRQNLIRIVGLRAGNRSNNFRNGPVGFIPTPILLAGAAKDWRVAIVVKRRWHGYGIPISILCRLTASAISAWPSLVAKASFSACRSPLVRTLI